MALLTGTRVRRRLRRISRGGGEDARGCPTGSSWGLVAVAAGGIAALVWSEWLNRRWSRMLVTERATGSLAVVVLGFRNPQPTANLVNRWRVRIAVRSIDPADRDITTLIFSGGATGAGTSEAQLMADYAESAAGSTGRMLIEDQSKTTWENVTNVLPLIENADRITFASQPAHALKARVYLCRQRPDLADRLVPAADYRPGEWFMVRPLLALYGLWTLRAFTPGERIPATRQPRRAGR